MFCSVSQEVVSSLKACLSHTCTTVTRPSSISIMLISCPELALWLSAADEFWHLLTPEGHRVDLFETGQTGLATTASYTSQKLPIEPRINVLSCFQRPVEVAQWFGPKAVSVLLLIKNLSSVNITAENYAKFMIIILELEVIEGYLSSRYWHVHISGFLSMCQILTCVKHDVLVKPTLLHFHPKQHHVAQLCHPAETPGTERLKTFIQWTK